jgi:uncharacterized protein (TIRG00374 family)
MEKTEKKKNNWLGLAIGIGVSVLAIGLLIYLIDFELTIDAIKRADFKFILLSAVFLICYLVTRSLAWRIILQDKISFQKTFWTINEGYMFNNILPFRLGELARAFLLDSTAKIPFWEVLSTILVERVFDIGLMAVFLLSSLPFVIGADWVLNSVITAGVFVVLGFGFLFWGARRPDQLMNIFERLTRPWPKLADFAKDKVQSLLDGLKALASVKDFFRVLFWMAMTWAFSFAWIYALMFSFFDVPEPLWAVFVVGVVALGVVAPSSPGFIGVYEAVMVGALMVFNVSEPDAFAFAVVSHGLFLVITTVLGAVGLSKDGQSLGAVYRGIGRRKNKEE